MFTFIFYVAAATFWASQNGHTRPAFTGPLSYKLIDVIFYPGAIVGFGIFLVYTLVREAIYKARKK